MGLVINLNIIYNFLEYSGNISRYTNPIKNVYGKGGCNEINDDMDYGIDRIVAVGLFQHEAHLVSQ